MRFIVPHFETNPIDQCSKKNSVITSYTAWFSERDSPLILIILNIVSIIPNLSSIDHRLSVISLRSKYFHGSTPYEMTHQPTRAKKISHCWSGETNSTSCIWSIISAWSKLPGTGFPSILRIVQPTCTWSEQTWTWKHLKKNACETEKKLDHPKDILWPSVSHRCCAELIHPITIVLPALLWSPMNPGLTAFTLILRNVLVPEMSLV